MNNTLKEGYKFTKIPKLPVITNQRIYKRVFQTKALISSLNANQQRSNETLEFLGDSVLGFLISDILIERFSSLTEGDLSAMKSKMTNNNILSEIAIAYKFHARPEFKMVSNGVISEVKLLSNTFEAYVGGLYLDAGLNGLPAIKTWLQALYKDFLKSQLHLYGMNSFKANTLSEFLMLTTNDTNPLSSFYPGIGPDVMHCGLDIKADFLSSTLFHHMTQLGSFEFSYDKIPVLPPQLSKGIEKNGTPLKASLLKINGLVCSTGVGFGFQECSCRANMAILKTAFDLKEAGKSCTQLSEVQSLLSTHLLPHLPKLTTRRYC